MVHVPELPEASGLAASRRTPGRFWSHNDSGEPVLVALDSSGTVTGRIRLAGAAVRDWEAVAVGSCSAGSCLHVADIGDNGADRDRITIYRVAEPAVPGGASLAAEALHATYPDGPQNAETLLIAPDGRLHVVTKGDTGPVALYRFPTDPRAGTTVRLERIGPARATTRLARDDRITDGAVSPDGRWVVLRSLRALTFYRAADLFAGRWREAGRVTVAALAESQGEAVAFGRGDAVYLMGEGGGQKRPGTFAGLRCALPP